MKEGADTAVRECLNIKPLEKVLVVTDRKMLKIGKVLYDASRKINLETTLMVMEPTTRDGEEPPKAVAEAMKCLDVVILATYHSLSHTKARRQACEAGARIASMPRITEFSLTKGGLTADYDEVDRLCKKMKKAVEGSKKMQVTSKNGTDITFSVEGRIWHDDEGKIHKSGHWGNLPAGEVVTAPVEGSANGAIAFDHMGDFGKKVRVTVKGGYAEEVENSKQLEKAFKQLGEKARIVAEIGIGTNPKAKIIGNVLEDEKVLGTVHIAFGNNLEGGGSNYIQFHKDGIIVKPTLRSDNKILIKEGEWVI